MTIGQIIAYYTGVLLTSGIIFFVLRAISVVFLEKKHKNNYLIIKSTATSEEINTDFENYFQKIKNKLYIILIIIVIIIYFII